jgi:hypothetical protein
MKGDGRLRIYEAMNCACSLYQERSLSLGVDVTSDTSHVLVLTWNTWGTVGRL